MKKTVISSKFLFPYKLIHITFKRCFSSVFLHTDFLHIHLPFCPRFSLRISFPQSHVLFL
ncbi:unnamed protein product [Meloidogyne enterolobii]|uniref:Uncharacterized protein n=1 Tax=Meloidogyne enterolobii TaxID=390850 RepID=A0ACB1AIP6_MELEN